MMSTSSVKKPNILFGFFYHYWISIVLSILLSILVYQSFIVNHFPISLSDKRTFINKNQSINQTLAQQNQTLLTELNNSSTASMEITESIARYRFGLIKYGEVYYQIQDND